MNLQLSFSVVFPLCAYMLIGFAAQHRRALSPSSVAEINRFIFRYLYPILMFVNTQSAASVLGSSSYGVLTVLFGSTLVLFFVMCPLAPVLVPGSIPKQTTFIQGVFRSNAMLFALPIVSNLYTPEQTGLVTICVAAIVPFFNVLSIILFETRRKRRLSLVHLGKSLLANPLIFGALMGVLFSVLGIQLPRMIQTTLNALSAMTTPLALIILGARLNFSGIRENLRILLLAAFIRLIAAPMLFGAVAYAAGYRGVAFFSIFALACVPTAVASYPMAEQMGGDGPLAGEIVAFTTVASILTVFLWICVLSALGLV